MSRILLGGNRPIFWNFEKQSDSIASTMQGGELFSGARIDHYVAVVPSGQAEIRVRWEQIKKNR